MPHTRTLDDRFWAKVEKTDGCWLWTAGTAGLGYGIIWPGGPPGTKAYAHRVSWEMHFGPIPDGLWVLHRCDTPPCVRPDHLFLGTHADNMADCTAKGRRFDLATIRPRGAVFHRSHLSPTDVLEIRRLARGGVQRGVIEAKFRLSRGTVGEIIRRQTWAWVAEEVAV